MERTSHEIWSEAVRTAKLIRAQRPTIERVEENLLHDRLTGDDARALVDIVSDGQILVGLIEQLERRGVAFE